MLPHPGMSSPKENKKQRLKREQREKKERERLCRWLSVTLLVRRFGNTEFKNVEELDYFKTRIENIIDMYQDKDMEFKGFEQHFMLGMHYNTIKRKFDFNLK